MMKLLTLLMIVVSVCLPSVQSLGTVTITCNQQCDGSTAISYKAWPGRCTQVPGCPGLSGGYSMFTVVNDTATIVLGTSSDCKNPLITFHTPCGNCTRGASVDNCSPLPTTSSSSSPSLPLANLSMIAVLLVLVVGVFA
eukprot:TRINITY_DN3619_c0_g1_i1.p1 TRINITY_DN3619_c0_g1~~TRINITY_DN3619_c0_g1_i1.p1  ORF type:complete len:139 (+),score=18.92 TRINITY_DN3619_c0_g1_i1:150-566(+)